MGGNYPRSFLNSFVQEEKMRYSNTLPSSCRFGLVVLLAGLLAAPSLLRATECAIHTMSSGVSVDERQEKHPEYALKVVFAQGKNLLAQMKVSIWQGEKKVVEASEAGPWFFAKLPPGAYRIVATLPNGKEKKATVELAKGGKQQVVTMAFP